jgi:hypothetical protein
MLRVRIATMYQFTIQDITLRVYGKTLPKSPPYITSCIWRYRPPGEAIGLNSEHAFVLPCVLQVQNFGMMTLHRQFRRRAVIVLTLFGLITWHIHWQRHDASIEVTQYPLLSKYVSGNRGNGGGMN